MARPDGFMTWWRARRAGLRAGGPPDVDAAEPADVQTTVSSQELTVIRRPVPSSRESAEDLTGDPSAVVSSPTADSAAPPAVIGRAGALVDRVMAEHVTPFLSVNGFRRRGRVYRRPAPHWTEVVNIQADRWNSAEARGLRVNLGLFHPDTHRVLWREEPPTLPLESHCQVRLGLGDLGEGGRPVRRPRDEWFRWRPDTDLGGLGRDVREALGTRVLPFLAAHRDWPDLRRLGHGRYPGESELDSAALAWFAGDEVLARRELSRVARRGPAARREAYEIALRLGLAFPAPDGEERLVLTVVPTDTAMVDETRRAADGLWLDLVELLEDDPAAYVHGDVRPGGRPWIELYGRDLDALRERIAPTLAAPRGHVDEVRVEVPPNAGPAASS